MTTPGATSTTPAPVRRAGQVQSAVPSCAQACFSSSVSQGYSKCSSSDLPCLCASYATNGETLGELALSCVRMQCPGTSNDIQSQAYKICSAQTNAVSPTHSILSLPVTETVPSSAAVIAAAETALFTETSGAPATATVVPNLAEAPSGLTYASATATSEPQVSGAKSSLTPGEIIGVVAGSVGAVIVAIGIYYLITCLKRRKATKKKKEEKEKSDRDSYDFVDQAPAKFSPFNFSQYSTRSILQRVSIGSKFSSEMWKTGSPYYALGDTPEQTGWPLHRDKELPEDPPPYSSRTITPESDTSDSSERTVSKLLPEKPGAAYFRNPTKPSYRGVVQTPATVFEEDRSPLVTSGDPTEFPQPPVSGQIAAGRGPWRPPQFVNQYERSLEYTRHPSLSLEIPKRPSRPESVKAMGAFPLPPPPSVLKVLEEARPQSSGQPTTLSRNGSVSVKSLSEFSDLPPLPLFAKSAGELHRINESQQQSAMMRPLDTFTLGGRGSVLNYYASPDARISSPASASEYSNDTTPIEEVLAAHPEPLQSSPSPTAMRITRPVFDRFSEVSWRTSFDSNEDAITPRPSTIAEEPLATSPISNLRYPAVPQSANLSIPRIKSPVYDSSPPRTSTKGIIVENTSMPITDHHFLPPPPPVSPLLYSGLQQQPHHTHTRSTSSNYSDTLVAKRRGSSVANDLALNFQTKPIPRTTVTADSTTLPYSQSHHRRNQRQVSPLTGHGLDMAPQQHERTPSGWPMEHSAERSWTPSPTPRRSGDDRYLFAEHEEPPFHSPLSTRLRMEYD